MNQGVIKTIGKKQTSRWEALFFVVDEVEGLMVTLGKDFWEVKEGISAEEFQEFIDGPSGPGFGQGALMNICKPIDTALMKGQTPYPPVFS